MNELGNTTADKNYKPSGISKAEEAALKAYPPLSVASVCLDGTVPVDLNTGARKRFVEGYEQAEKDLALTWEDIRKIVVLFSDVSFEFFDTKSANEMCEETLTRFKQFKEEKK